MKKIFVFCSFIGLMVIGACSGEPDVNTNEDTAPHSSMRLNSSLQSEYEDMIASSTYIDYLAAVDDFTDKMNFDGDVSVFNDKNDVLDWISTNISQTDFTNYAEAEDDYDGLITKQGLMFAANKPFFEELQNSQKGDFFEIINVVYEPSDEDECTEACKKTLLECNSSATLSHADAMEAIYASVDFNDAASVIQANEKATLQLVIYTSMLTICRDNHQICLIDCLG